MYPTHESDYAIELASHLKDQKSLKKAADNKSEDDFRSFIEDDLEKHGHCALDYSQKAYLFSYLDRDKAKNHMCSAIKKLNCIKSNLEKSPPKNAIEGLFAAVVFCQLALCYLRYDYLYKNKNELCKTEEGSFKKVNDIIYILLNDASSSDWWAFLFESRKCFPQINKDIIELISQELQNQQIDHSPYVNYLNMMGRVYFNRQDYEPARQEWEKAWLLDPNDPKICYNIGVVHVNEALNLNDKNLKNLNLDKGKYYLNKALKLFKNKEYIVKTHYWLGMLNLESRKFEEAVSHFKICLAMVKDIRLCVNEGRNQEFELLPRLRLGQAYLPQKRYDECEIEFEEIIKSKDEIINKKEQICKFIKFIDPKMNVAEILIYANLGLASSCLEKQVKIEKTKICIKNAEEEAREKHFQDEIAKSKNTNRRINADIYATKGWLKCLEIQKTDSILDFEGRFTIGPFSPLGSIGASMSAIIEDSILSIEKDKLRFKGGEIKNAIMCFGNEDKTYVERAKIDEIEIKKEAKGTIQGYCFNGGQPLELLGIGDFVITELDLQSAEMLSLKAVMASKREVPTINSAIFWLEESLSLSADPQTCLHLAQALEIKWGLTSDPKAQEDIKGQILARCKLAKQLDIMEDYKEDIEAISKKHEEKKEEPKKKLTPISTMSLSIEGTAKGEISKADSKEKGSEKK